MASGLQMTIGSGAALSYTNSNVFSLLPPDWMALRFRPQMQNTDRADRLSSSPSLRVSEECTPPTARDRYIMRWTNKNILDTHTYKVYTEKKTLDTHCLLVPWYIVLTHGMESSFAKYTLRLSRIVFFLWTQRTHIHFALAPYQPLIYGYAVCFHHPRRGRLAKMMRP